MNSQHNVFDDGLEMVKDKEAMEFFSADEHAGHKFQSLALKNGLAFYGTLFGSRRNPAFKRSLPMWVSPPLCITKEQVDDLMDRLDRTVTEWEEALGAA